jgi:hypothetical protein
MNFGQTPHFFFFSSLFFPLSLQTDQEITLAGHPSLSLSYSLCPVASEHKGGVRPEAVLPKIALLPLSHSVSLQPPIDDEPPPRRSPTTPPASYPGPAPHLPSSLSPTPTESAPLETRRRPQASGRSLASGCPETPPSTPNSQPPPTPSVDLAPARALPLLVHALHTESVVHIPKRARPRQPRKTTPCCTTLNV